MLTTYVSYHFAFINNMWMENIYGIPVVNNVEIVRNNVETAIIKC